MPLALMMFGFGVGLEASIVAYACVWPILIVTIAAVRDDRAAPCWTWPTSWK